MKLNDHIFKITEWVFWPAFLSISSVVGATSVIMERSRNGIPIAAWQPFTWEFSSAFFILILIPLILMIDRRWPLQQTTWPKIAALHVLLTIPFSLVHVGGMVTIRKAVYALEGRVYDFGDVPVELLYEYRKDAMAYALILFVTYAYRHFRYRYSEASIEDKSNSKKPLTRVLIKTGGKETFLKLDDIERLEAAGNYVNIHSRGDRYFLRATLAQLEGKLPADKFVRVHRSNIVNLDHIKEIIPTPSGDARIIMDSGDHVSLSRRYRDRLKPLEI